MDDLILGYTWEEIHAAQQGEPLRKMICPRGVYDHPCEKNDVDLLIIHGLKGLQEMRFDGVIDRLCRAGLIDNKEQL